MKKLLLIVMLALFLPGCAPGSVLKREEGITADYAYVVGKHRANSTEDLHFSRVAEGSGPSGPSRFSVGYYYSEYTVYKVLPGRYTANEMVFRSSSLSGNPLVSVNLEAGKITYIGDIEFNFKSIDAMTRHLGSITGSEAVRVTITVKDNSEAVKKAISEKYPELAGKLSAIFVYRPAF